MIGTRGDLGTLLNLTKGRISQLEKAKVFRPTRGGKFDLEKAQEAYLAYLAARGTRSKAGTAEGVTVKEIADVQLDRQRTKLEYEKAVMELLKLKAQVTRGELINPRAARQLAGLQCFDMGRRIWMQLPLSFIHEFARDREETLLMDAALSRIMESAFRATNMRDIGRETARVVRQAERVIKAIEAGNPSLPEIARKFAEDIRQSFSCMKPEWPKKLGLKFLVRGDPHPLIDEEDSPSGSKSPEKDGDE